MSGCGCQLHRRDRVSGCGCGYVQMPDMLNVYGPACYDVHKYHQNCTVDQYRAF